MTTDDLLPEFREWLEQAGVRPGEVAHCRFVWWLEGPTCFLPAELFALLKKDQATYPTSEQAMLDLQQAWLKWRQTTTATT